MTLISTTTDALPAASARDRRPVDYLSRYSIRMEDTIPEVEAALVNGTIEEVLTRPAVSEVIGPDLTGRYRRIAGYKIKHDATFRRSWTQRFLAAFKVSLQEPRALFPASSATRNPNPVRREMGHPRPPSILAAYRDTLVTLRPDQVLSARRWGFWFDFDDELLERAYADFLLKVARQELSSQIESLWKIEATYLSGKSKLKPNTEWSFGHRGESFEHLMLDVLNETTPIARRAPLAEDILERTDLRLAFPSLTRRKGARAQVGLATDPIYHNRKVSKLRLPEEFVILTPLELAHFAVHRPASPLFNDFPWESLWASFGAAYLNENEFANELHQLFVDSFGFATSHPLGPMWILPPPLRYFIRVFAEAAAIDATHRLRSREQLSRRWHGSADKFTTPYWRAKFSQDPAESLSLRSEKDAGFLNHERRRRPLPQNRHRPRRNRLASSVYYLSAR